MKKRLLLLLFTALSLLPLHAYDFEADGIYYNKNGYNTNSGTSTCSVTFNVTSVTRSVSDGSYSGDIVIPESVIYNGEKYSVTEIDWYAFYGCTGLTSVSIPNSVTKICSGAFERCGGLTSVTIPNSVTEICGGAFNDCIGLTTVSIPNSVTSISDNAFSGCPLQKVYIENNGQLAVFYRAGITDAEFYLNGELINLNEYVTTSADGFCYADSGKILIDVPSDITNVVIPEGVTTIGQNAFAGFTLESLTIPSTIEKVEANAFANCSIRRVNFTDFSKWYANAKLENLASNPYRDCGAYAGGIKVAAPELEEGMEEIPDYKNAGLVPYKDEIELPSTLKRIGAYAFYNAKELYAVFMPEGLEEIGESAFEGCELLENTELPSTLLSIEDNAFKGCSTLTEITLPEGLTNLGHAVFQNCYKLEKAVLVADIDALGDNLFRSCRVLYKVYFPLNLKQIGNFTFAACGALDEITLPATLESIGDFAFACGYGDMLNCDKGSLSILTIPNNVKMIGVSSFANQSIANLNIGSGIEIIPIRAFECNPIKIINFSEGLKEIGAYAFSHKGQYFDAYDGYSISSVKLPSTITTIGEYAFSDTKILELVIPDKVTALPIESCGYPSILTIGSGVKTIDSNAFNFAILHVLRVKANTPPSLSNAFNITDDQNDALVMIVNAGRASNYQKNARWKQINEIVEEGATEVVIYMTGEYPISEEIKTTTGLYPSQVTKMQVIGELTAEDLRIIKENMISLQSLDLSTVTNLTAIPVGQFQGSLLTEIKFPANLETIEAFAFADCPLLQISELPDAITSIGSDAFQNCPRVTISKLPASLKSIDNGAFYGCTGIREIIAGDALETVGGGAFAGCSLLESVDFSAATSLSSTIQGGTFSGCRELDEIILPETITTVFSNAFAGTAIRDLSFIGNATNIESGAFSGCRRLVAANFPEGITSVSSNILANCPRLVAVSMPAGTTEVADNVFNGDKKLANISCAAINAPAAQTGAFDNIRDRYILLTVPAQSYRSYLNATQWGKFRNIKNSIISQIGNGLKVSIVAEEEFQDMVKEDELEAAAEAAAQEQTEEPAEVARRRSARRAAARAVTYDGKQFASLFDGAQIFTGEDGKGSRIFLNPEEGVNITSILYNGEEMLSKLDGNSLLLPAGGKGTLKIETDAVVSIEETDADIDFNAPYQVYNLSGIMVGTSTANLPAGIYVVRQGAKTTKLAI